MTEHAENAQQNITPDESVGIESMVIAARSLAARTAEPELESRLREVLSRELDGSAPTVETYATLFQRLVALFGPGSEWESHFLLTSLGLESETESELPEILASLDDSEREPVLALLRVLRASFLPQMSIVLALRDRPGEDWLQLERGVMSRPGEDELEIQVTFERYDRHKFEIRTSPNGLLTLNALLLRILNELPEEQDAFMIEEAVEGLETELRFAMLRFGSDRITSD